MCATIDVAPIGFNLPNIGSPYPRKAKTQRIKLKFTTMLLILSSSLFLLPFSWSSPPPNIVMIVADDLGWGDAPWHNPDIQAPRQRIHFCVGRQNLKMIGNFLQTVGSRKGRCGAKSELCPTGDDFFVIVFGDSFFWC